MRYITYILWFILIIIIAIFVSLNSHVVQINYYFGSFRIYFPLLLLIMLIIGAIIGILAVLPWFFRSKTQVRRLRQQMKQQQRKDEQTT